MPLNCKRQATTESEDLYQHLAKRRSVSTPQLPIYNEEEEPVTAQAYTQTTLKKDIKRKLKLAKQLRQHFKTTFESIVAAKRPAYLTPHTIHTHSLIQILLLFVKITSLENQSTNLQVAGLKQGVA